MKKKYTYARLMRVAIAASNGDSDDDDDDGDRSSAFTRREGRRARTRRDRRKTLPP